MAFHLAWIRDTAAVLPVVTLIEQRIHHPGARPHWGKIFAASAEDLTSSYDRLPDFLAAIDSTIPRQVPQRLYRPLPRPLAVGPPGGCHVSRGFRSRPPAAGDTAPPRSGTRAPDPRQRRRPALRRRALGEPRAGGARHVRRRAALAGRHGALLRRSAHPALEVPEARDYVLEGVDPRWHGPLAAATLRACMDGLDSPRLAEFLGGGITSARSPNSARNPSIAFHSLDPDDFVLAPLPNLLYQRDTSCWIYGGVSIDAMRRPARIRETVTDEAIYRWHPMFAQAGSMSGITARMPRRPPSRARHPRHRPRGGPGQDEQQTTPQADQCSAASCSPPGQPAAS